MFAISTSHQAETKGHILISRSVSTLILNMIPYKGIPYFILSFHLLYAVTSFMLINAKSKKLCFDSITVRSREE